jgi:hypothetical protein
MAIEKSNKLAKVEDLSKLATTDAIPEYLRRQEGTQTEGMEGMERGDLKMPRLSLCQSMTPQRKKTDPKYIEDLNEGDFFNSITSHNFGHELKFVPLLWYKSRILFTPLDEGGGLLCRSEDSKTGVGDPGGACIKCQHSEWRKGPAGKRIAPRCTLFHNYLILTLEQDRMPSLESLICLSLKSTGLDAATDLNALIQLRGAKSAYAGIYKLASASDTNAAGQEYHVPVVKNAGWVSQDMAAFAEQVYQSVKGMKDAGTLQVDETVQETFPPEPGSEEL